MSVNQFGIADPSVLSPLNVGDITPYFSGIDQEGNFLSSERLSQQGPYILFFYRGFWCNFCIRHLSKFQEKLNELDDQGIKVVVVTPEKYDHIRTTIDKAKIKFSVIHDEFNYIMESFGVAYEVDPQYVEEKLIPQNLDLKQINNQSVPMLPVPASFVINSHKKISYVHYDINYEKRADIDEMMAALYGVPTKRGEHTLPLN